MLTHGKVEFRAPFKRRKKNVIISDFKVTNIHIQCSITSAYLMWLTRKTVST